jgi:hypothetical protein
MTDPNFLFSLPPFVEQKNGVNYITLMPSGRDDFERMQAAIDRIAAVGGILRLSAGDFYLDDPVWIGDSIRFG